MWHQTDEKKSKNQFYLNGHVDTLILMNYLTIHVSVFHSRLTDSVGENAFEVTATQAGGERVRMRIDVLDRHDGVYIVRLKLFSAPENVEVSIKYNKQHVADSPYKIKGKQKKVLYPASFKLLDVLNQTHATTRL